MDQVYQAQQTATLKSTKYNTMGLIDLGRNGNYLTWVWPNEDDLILEMKMLKVVLRLHFLTQN